MRVLFSHQFVISKTTHSLPVHWSWQCYGNFKVAAAPDLPIIELTDEDEATVAILLGWPIDIITSSFLPARQKLESASIEAFEILLRNFAGRWVALNLNNEQVYADAMSSQSAVIHAKQQIVCSSAALLPAHLQVLDIEMHRRMDVANSENFYPFGLLPHHGVRRLLPSHTFSFKTAETRRYWWPTPTSWQGLNQAATIVSDQVTRVISACIDTYPVRQGLSAGFETRLMLACSKPFREQVKFWTRVENKQGSVVDQKVAIALSSKFALDHELTSSDIRQVNDEEDWLNRTGYCIGGGALKSRHIIDSKKQVYIALTGIGGETCRAFYWPSTYLPKQLNVQLLLQLASLPPLDKFIIAGQRYLEEICHLPIHVQLGMFYLENRVSAYASPHKYGNENGIIFIYPLNHHDTVNQMLICPQGLQITSALHRQVIRQRWPEIEQLPYNLPLEPLPRLIKKFKKILSNYKRELYLFSLYRCHQTNQ